MVSYLVLHLLLVVIYTVWFFVMYPEIQLMGSPYLSDCLALIDDLGLVPSDSPQGIALSRYGSKPRLCDVYRAKANLYEYYRMKNFFAGCGRYRRVRPDHSRELTLF